MVYKKVVMKKTMAALLAVTMTGSMSATMLTGVALAKAGAKGNAPSITETFNDVKDESGCQGTKMGNPTLVITDQGYKESKGLLVSERKENYFGYSYDLSQFAGNKINVSAQVAVPGVKADAQNEVRATLKTSKTGADDSYTQVAVAKVSGANYAVLEVKNFEVPAGCDSYTLYFESEKDVDYILDEVNIQVAGEYKDPNAVTYANYKKYPSLMKLYKNYFKMGVACEAIDHWGNNLSEIGNSDKEALIKQEFNSITFGNELKPAYNMGYKSKKATETNLPFVIDKSAKEMLDWAKKNKVGVRGHVLVWHSQCEDAVFCKGYKPVYTDESKTTLDPSCLVSRKTMLKRLKSYIDSTMEYMYKNGYADTIYAWDVVNEAIEPGNKDNLRDSYWYKTIGSDFIYYSFKYSREAVNKYSKKYAKQYKVDVKKKKELAKIQPKLFYNDYNEFMAEKRDAMIHILTEDFAGHNLKKEKLIDGIGMQGHIGDTTNLDDFITALNMFSKAAGEVHITELDVARTGKDANADYYQAAYYQELFSRLIQAKKDGANLSCVTIWGLTDDNSWKKESNPLIFNGDLSKKLAFDGIVNAVKGGKLPEPAYIAKDLSDRSFNFEAVTDADPTVEQTGFFSRGDSKLEVQKKEVHDGKNALLVTGRTASWNGASFDVSDFLGQTIEISAWVKCDDKTVKVSADIDGKWPNIATTTTGDGQWHKIYGTYQLPDDMTALSLYFESEGTKDIYVDDVEVHLVGLTEGFEGETHKAIPRGVGHMPVLTVAKEGAADKDGHSLLVHRSEAEATVKFNASAYIGKNVTVSAMVKTDDSKVKIGLDGSKPTEFASVDVTPGKWTEVKTTFKVDSTLTSANIYFETNGKADYSLDDVKIAIGEYKDDVEGEQFNFMPRWGGAGTVSKVKEGNNNVAKLSDRTETYFGLAFDVTPYLGMKVELSLDVKTDDSKISVSGDIADLWPNYITEKATPGKYVTLRKVITLPKDVQSLNLYVETDGKSDIFVDNVSIKPVGLSAETK